MLETQRYFRATGGRLGSSPRGTYMTQTPDVILRGDGSTLVDVASLERYDRSGAGLHTVTLPQAAVAAAWR